MFGGHHYWISTQPYMSLGLVAVVLLVLIQQVSEKRQRRRLAASRAGETICEFARSFNRGTDTWILRAVYQEMSKFLAVEDKPTPIRAEDHTESDLKIDPEDLDDLAVDIAGRSGRSMTDAKHNPFYRKVHTVRDMVGFLEHQPRISNIRQHS